MVTVPSWRVGAPRQVLVGPLAYRPKSFNTWALKREDLPTGISQHILLTRLHSSRMHTARSLTVSPSVLWSGGVPALFRGGGVWSGWGVSGLGGECLVLGGACLVPGGGLVGRGLPGPGRGCPPGPGGIPACTEADPPCKQNDRQV